MFVRELMVDIRAAISLKKVASAAIPEEYLLLRTLQFAAQYWRTNAVS